MVIYVVQPGDTIESIASANGVSTELLVSLNGLNELEALVVGQTIVILIPETVHIVEEGNTLATIATLYDVTVMDLYKNNPWLILDDSLDPGEQVVISYQGTKLGTLSVSGYAYPYINRETLRKTLPYLTYLSLFTYGFLPDGSLIPIDDQELINLAYEYQVMPVLLISTLNEEGVFSNELASQLLNNKEAQQTLTNNLIAVMQEKGYQGLELDFEYIFASDKDAYVEFVDEITEAMNRVGFVVFTDLAPKTSADQSGLLYEAHDYPRIGDASNYAFLMTYEWGYAYGPPMAVAPIPNVRKVLEYGLTEIPAYKIFMGFPNYGYDWPLPYEKAVTKANTLGNVEAVARARQYGTEILFDETSMAPYYYYTDESGVEHVVWFEDARSTDAKVQLAAEFELGGMGVWNIMKYFPALWLVLNSRMNLRKLV